VHNDAQTYYFSVVDISGCTVTVNSYSGYTGTYSVFDTFSIDKCPSNMPAPARPRSSSMPPSQLAAPALSLQYLNIDPKQASANQPVSILTNVVNTGGVGGDFTTVLKINGLVEQSRTVNVGPGASYPVKFIVTKVQPGTYSVDINGQRGNFTILSAANNRGTIAGHELLIAGLTALFAVLCGLLIVLFLRRIPGN